MYTKKNKAFVLLQDGVIFYGKSHGIEGTAYGEICFNTAMTGYQETFSDPSYFEQIIVMTNAHIGNYGIFDKENQSKNIKISGLICRNISEYYSRPLATQSIKKHFEEQQKVIVSNVDTRALVSYIRTKGVMNVAISTEIDKLEEIKQKLAEKNSMEGLELASKVSTSKPYFYGDESSKYKVAVIDLGVKENILKNIAERDVYIKVYPHNTSFEEISSWNPDGYFISNGPGDPQTLSEVIKTVQKIIEQKAPLFGICLGHQVIALACGLKTYKMHHGHRGVNHPIKRISTDLAEITSQNHGFAVEENSLAKTSNIKITHSHINDNTVAGLELKDAPVFSVQYHPEASPGPNDSKYLFDLFLSKIKEGK